MWSRDPFKAKWSIIALAYTTIRNKVGKRRAPLGRFLSLVCPELGIINTTQYCAMMSWDIGRDADGVLKMVQTSVPDVASFDDHIQHSIMTEKDVIHFCAENGYITRSVARILAGDPASPSNDSALSQHSLLATAPVTFPPVSTTTASFLGQTVNNPRAAATEVLGFDVDELLGPAERSESSNLPTAKPYEWSNCTGNLYDAEEGSFNFEALGDNYRTSIFDVGEISDPQSFDELFSAVVQDGFYHNDGKAL